MNLVWLLLNFSLAVGFYAFAFLTDNRLYVFIGFCFWTLFFLSTFAPCDECSRERKERQ